MMGHPLSIGRALASTVWPANAQQTKGARGKRPSTARGSPTPLEEGTWLLLDATTARNATQQTKGARGKRRRVHVAPRRF